MICKECAECCKHHPFVELSNKEINSLELLTGLHINTFLNSKGKTDEGYFLQFKENGNCFFLNENNGRYFCEVYKARPDICRNYPSTPCQQKACDSNMEKLINTDLEDKVRHNVIL